MKLLRVGPTGAERPALLADDGRLLDLSGLTSDIDGAFLAGGGLDRVRAAHALPEITAPCGTGRRSPAPARWSASA